MKLSALVAAGLIFCACGGAPRPSIPHIAPVVAPLPGPAPERSAEDAALEAELEAGLETSGPPSPGAGGATP